MTRVRGFMTVGCLGDYRGITRELVEAIVDSRLYERAESIDLAVLGDADGQAFVDEVIRPFPRFRVAYRTPDVLEFEYPALGLLQDACRDGDGVVFYVHTKGASRHPDDPYARAWRRLMLDVVVYDHARCLDELARADGVGTNWRGNHFSGNYWWARASHVLRLPDIRRLRVAPMLLSRDPGWNTRLQPEFWLTSVHGRFVNLGVSYLDLYQTIRWSCDAADIVNDLLRAGGGDRYLEVVTGGPTPYHDRIVAQVRDVAPVPAVARLADGAAPEVADDARYDVIFLDAWHEAGLTRDLVDWSLPRLRPGGAIVIHDTNPPSEWHQRPAAAFRPGEEWNGAAWEAVVAFRRDRPEVAVETVDTDWGCTVIRPERSGRDSERNRDHVDAIPPEASWAVLSSRRAELLNLTTPASFRRSLGAVPYAAGRRPIVSRADVVNALIAMHGYRRYLEVGVAAGETFGRVAAPVRHGVDPAGSATFSMTSDEFFASDLGCPDYDLVFVDALHEGAACLRDLERALARLAPGGAIVVHDANPPTEWHQRPAVEFEPGTEWNGTVWRAIVGFRRRHPGVALVTLDVDFGCAVIRPGARAVPLDPAIDVASLDWETFDRRRAELLLLVPATTESLKALRCDAVVTGP